jgi:hypothetical protein
VANDENGMRDEVAAELNPEYGTSPGGDVGPRPVAYDGPWPPPAGVPLGVHEPGAPEQDAADDTSTPSIPDRPADGAPKAKWAAYAEAHGLDLRAQDWTRGELIAWCSGERPQRLIDEEQDAARLAAAGAVVLPRADPERLVDYLRQIADEAPGVLDALGDAERIGIAQLLGRDPDNFSQSAPDAD